MARNGSGIAIPPASVNPVASGTTITTNWANTTVTDIYNELTNSLPRDGQAPMTAQLKIIDGSVSAPGFGFNGESSSGLYRPSTGVVGLSVSGILSLSATSTGVSVPGTVGVTGASTLTGAVSMGSTLNITGATTLSSTLAVTGNTTVSSVSASGIISSSSAEFARIANNGAYISGYNTAGAVRTGYLQFNSGANVQLTAEASNNLNLSTAGGSMVLSSAGATTFTGSVTATSFIGSGASLTGTAASLTSGSTNALSATALGVSNVWTNVQQFKSGTLVGTVGAAGNLMVLGDAAGTNAATMCFHRPGVYAINMGLDTDNVFRLGGYSNGLNTYRFQSDTAGNMTIGGGFFPGNNPNGGALAANTVSTYGSLQITSSKGGYSGLAYPYAGVVSAMFDNGGSGGDYDYARGIWHYYWNSANSCLAINGSATTAGYAAQINGSAYVSSNLLVGGVVQGTTLTTSAAGLGYVNVQRSGAGNTGYVEFYGANAVRNGYIGNGANTGSTDTGGISYVAGAHTFNGTVNVSSGSGQFYVGGGITRFESAEQTLPTANGLYYVAHGGPRKPDIVQVVWRCKTAEGGWSAGHEITATDQSTDGSRAYQTFRDGINAGLVVVTPGQIAMRGTSATGWALFAPTAANWRMVVYCHWL